MQKAFKTSEEIKAQYPSTSTGPRIPAPDFQNIAFDQWDALGDMAVGIKKSSLTVIGDSLVECFPYFDNTVTLVSPTDEQDIANTSSWTNIIRKTLGITVHNRGIGGQTTAEMIARFSADVLADKPTHCMIEGGINDVVKLEKAVSASGTLNNFITMIQICRNNNIVPIICISGSIGTVDGWITQAMVDDLNNRLNTLINYGASNNIPVVNFWGQLMDNSTGQGIIAFSDANSQGHPNTAGYKRLGDYACYRLKDILPEFIGTNSPLEKIIYQAISGQAPYVNYSVGAVGIEGAPTEGNPLFWTCMQAGKPGTWGATGFVRDARATAPNRTWLLNSTDTGDYFFQKNDIVLSVLPNKNIDVYRVDASGYANVHPISAERATFTYMSTLLANATVSSGPQAYQDIYASPNPNRYYKAGDTVYYDNGAVYYMRSDGYHASSPNTPHAAYTQIG